MKQDNYWMEMQPFFGVVEEVIDESYVRVRIFGIHPLDKEKVKTEDLPPALVLMPTTGGHATSGNLGHNVEVDSWVFGHITDMPYCMQPIVTHTIKGTSYSMSKYRSEGGQFVGQGTTGSSDGISTGASTGSNAGGGSTGTGGTSDGGTSPSTPVNIPGNNNLQKTYNYLYAKLQAENSSDPHLHASGICGVLLLETSGINPTVVGGYKGRAWGICQWLGPRRAALFKRYGQTKSLTEQLDFMWYELNTLHRRAKGLILRSTNLPDAVAGMCVFEGAEEMKGGKLNRAHSNFKKRLAFAYKVYKENKYTGNSGSGGGGSSGGSQLLV